MLSSSVFVKLIACAKQILRQRRYVAVARETIFNLPYESTAIIAWNLRPLILGVFRLQVRIVHLKPARLPQVLPQDAISPRFYSVASSSSVAASDGISRVRDNTTLTVPFGLFMHNICQMGPSWLGWTVAERRRPL